jgi:hypothetical protein
LIDIEGIVFGVGDLNANKPPLSAWKLVCRPKNRGGLGVIRLHLQNEALLIMKDLENFFLKLI